MVIEQTTAQLHLAHRVSGDTAEIWVSGDLDLVTRSQLDDLAERLTGPEVPHLVVDLGGVAFMDTGGMASLVVLWQHAERLGGVFTVRNVTADIGRRLRITGLDFFLGAPEGST